MEPQSTTVGVIGGGQLAWMMAQAAPSLGLSLIVQTPDATDPAVALARALFSRRSPMGRAPKPWPNAVG